MKVPRALLLVALGLALAALAWQSLGSAGRPPAPLEAMADRLADATAPPPPEPLPVDEQSAFFRDAVAASRWGEVRAQLLVLRETTPEHFASNRLGYLLARAALQTGQFEEAAEELDRIAAAGPPWDRLAHHQRIRLATVQDPDLASRLRREYLERYPDSQRTADLLEAELVWLDRQGNPEEIFAFVEHAGEALGDRGRRDLEARMVGVFAAQEDWDAAVAAGNRLLADSIGDDPAERVSLALDHPQVLRRLSPAELARLGETYRNHRHFDHAVATLTAARADLPRRGADLDFSIGRAHFFAEDFEAAITAYLRAASGAENDADRARYLFHASRAAQLLGDDERSLELIARTIAVPGRHAGTVAAIHNRLKTRIHQGRLDEADQNLELIRRGWPRDGTLLGASLAYASAMVAAGRGGDALETLDRIPRRLIGTYAPSEIAYWKARALEPDAPGQAVRSYLTVLRSEAPTHFAHLARQRLREAGLQSAVEELRTESRQGAEEAFAAGDLVLARRLHTDVWLLSPTRDEEALERLTETYRALPDYREVLELEALPFPSYPLPEDADATDRLMAMGLFDEVAPEIADRFPLSPLASGLARAEAYRLAFATRPAIGTAEMLMGQVPDDYVLDLLPRRLLELLYPRYFWDTIVAESGNHGADPRLMLSIMREESRFDPRAKSPAAARGLMQFVITTARDVGSLLGLTDVRAESLYEPPVIIRLGARYVGDLLGEFEGDRYAAAAAYNAGPNQSRLWRRLQPAPGPDYFLTTVNFDETKHYVRKVLNSYARYGEIYADEPPSAGVQAQP